MIFAKIPTLRVCLHFVIPILSKYKVKTYKVVSVVETITEPILQTKEEAPQLTQISLNIPIDALPDKGFNNARGKTSTKVLSISKNSIIKENMSSRNPLVLIILTDNNIPNKVGNVSLKISKPSLDPSTNNENAFLFLMSAITIVNIINTGNIKLINSMFPYYSFNR